MSSIADNHGDIEFLRAWQERMLPKLETTCFIPCENQNRLTALTYYFRPTDEKPDYESFKWTRFAILKTWKECGLLKTIIVTNAVTPAQKKIRSEFPDYIEIQIEPTLIPGDINSMTLDCHTKLHARFSTQFVMIIQDDGFPLHPGINRYVGKYDYVGAPWRRNVFQAQLYGMIHRQWPMNGGFCIRSKKFCHLIAMYWNKYYSFQPFDFDKHSDDVFCTITLPNEHRWFRYQVHTANSRTASTFSYDAFLPSNFKRDVLGFHGAKAFREIVEASGIKQ